MTEEAEEASGQSSSEETLMEIVLLDQTRTFIFACFLGICMGLLYDIFDVFPRIVCRRYIRALCDILYCIIFMICFTALVIFSAGGVLRWYILGGALIGLALYFLGAAFYVRAFLCAAEECFVIFVKLVRKVLCFIENLFCGPTGN